MPPLRVYPRVCGGTAVPRDHVPHLDTVGLSPRVRGNRVDIRPRTAHVVQPVYPRVCGGTEGELGVGPGETGLSPRVRGNPHRPGRPAVEHRSIPACAGEPGDLRKGHKELRVYPRVCGGTCRISSWVAFPEGLSPRVRGNPSVGRAALSTAPARVYPRVCGGTGSVCLAALERNARSVYPRVCGGTRVSHLSDDRRRLPRSIPACAGEPPPRRTGKTTPWVYPRVCGGTAQEEQTPFATWGLSPRVRGNRSTTPGFCLARRSIPACAGEPSPVPCTL